MIKLLFEIDFLQEQWYRRTRTLYIKFDPSDNNIKNIFIHVFQVVVKNFTLLQCENDVCAGMGFNNKTKLSFADLLIQFSSTGEIICHFVYYILNGKAEMRFARKVSKIEYSLVAR